MKKRRFLASLGALFMGLVIMGSDMCSIKTQAAMVTVVKNYDLYVKDGKLVNTDNFFNVSDYKIEGGELIIPDSGMISFTVENKGVGSFTEKTEKGPECNSSDYKMRLIIDAQRSATDWSNLKNESYIFYNQGGDFIVEKISCAVKVDVWGDQYTTAKAEGKNWTLISGDVGADATANEAAAQENAKKEEELKAKEEELAKAQADVDSAKKAADSAKKAADAAKKAADASSAENAAQAEAIAATVDGANAQAMSIIEEAQATSEEIIANAQTEADQITEAAKEEASQILYNANEIVTRAKHAESTRRALIGIIIVVTIAAVGEGGFIFYIFQKNRIKL